jgi:DNA-binding transcriptional LysR family regulator
MSSENQRTLVFRFQGVSPAEAGQKILELREDLLDSADDVRAEVRKEDPTTQDFGATLVLVLGSGAVVAIAKGIQRYLSRDREGELVIEEDGSVRFKGNSKDAARIAEALGKPKPSPQ